MEALRYCPEWAPPLWRAREWKGSISVYDLLGLRGGRETGMLVGALTNALVSVENAVEARINPPK